MEVRLGEEAPAPRPRMREPGVRRSHLPPRQVPASPPPRCADGDGCCVCAAREREKMEMEIIGDGDGDDDEERARRRRARRESGGDASLRPAEDAAVARETRGTQDSVQRVRREVSKATLPSRNVTSSNFTLVNLFLMVQESKCWYNTRRRARRRITAALAVPIMHRLASSEIPPARFAHRKDVAPHSLALSFHSALTFHLALSLSALFLPFLLAVPYGLEPQHALEELRERLRLAPRLLRERRQLQEVAPLILEVHGGSALQGLEAELLDDGPPATRTTPRRPPAPWTR